MGDINSTIIYVTHIILFFAGFFIGVMSEDRHNFIKHKKDNDDINHS